MAQIIDGKAIAADIRREIAADVAALSSDHNLVPGLAVVIVGCRKDSQTYVQMKRKACAEVGIRSVDIDLPEDISEAALVAEVHRLNADPAVHGAVCFASWCVSAWPGEALEAARCLLGWEPAWLPGPGHQIQRLGARKQCLGAKLPIHR